MPARERRLPPRTRAANDETAVARAGDATVAAAKASSPAKAEAAYRLVHKGDRRDDADEPPPWRGGHGGSRVPN